MDGLLGEEVVGLQRDALGHVLVGGDWLGRAVDRLLQILHNKLGLLPLLAHVDTHEAVAAADIDKGALLGIHVG